MSYSPATSTLGQRNLTYGDGSDGSLSVTVGGGTANLTVAKFYVGVVVGTSAHISNRNWHMFVLYTFDTDGLLGDTTGSASGATGGSGLAAGSLPLCGSGQTGSSTASTGTAGGAGVGLTGDFGGGGKSDGTTQADGSHSQVFARCQLTFHAAALSGPVQAIFGAPSGTARGSGDGTNAGGGAGAAGRSIFLAAQTLHGRSTATIVGAGGNGANGVAGTAGGGGAGGGAGCLMVLDRTTGTAITPSVLKGTAGSGSTTAGAGGAGTNGTALTVTNT